MVPFDEPESSRIARRAAANPWAHRLGRERLETCWMILTFVAFFAACVGVSLATLWAARVMSTSMALPIATQFPARLGGYQHRRP